MTVLVECQILFCCEKVYNIGPRFKIEMRWNDFRLQFSNLKNSGDKGKVVGHEER